MADRTIILGGGVTGLAAGVASGFPVYEAAPTPGGICSSYHVLPGQNEPTRDPAERDEAYRFEIGGGHWVFGGDPAVLEFVGSLVDVQRYARRSSVYFPDTRRYVPYPIQNHLRHLGSDTAVRALAEMSRPKTVTHTMADWLVTQFGPTLCEAFFTPFHELYTAGLHTEITPQDAYKSPVDFQLALQGALDDVPLVGYNTTFLYPREGLDGLVRSMTGLADVRLEHRAVAIDLDERVVRFHNGERASYDRLLCTLPLNAVVAMTGLPERQIADPHTSVLVLNIGAKRGPRCPDDHWLYIPRSDAGFHRVGFYSNVDDAFLPASARGRGERVSIYVERAYLSRPDASGIAAYREDVVRELREWGFIDEVEAVHPTWIEVAYTWSRPGSIWVGDTVARLQDYGVFQVGRYARWIFQGIADSIRDGFIAGTSFARGTSSPRGESST